MDAAGRELKEIADAHVRAAETAMRAMRPNTSPRRGTVTAGARRAPHRNARPGEKAPRLTRLAGRIRLALRMKRQPRITVLDPRTHIRINEQLQRAEMFAALAEARAKESA